MTTPTGILLGNAVASGDFGDDSPLANIWETILAIEAEAALPALDALRAEIDDLLLDALDQLTGWTSNTSNRAVTTIDLIEKARAALREGETHHD